MRKSIIVLAMLACVCGLRTLAADEVYLKSGGKIVGKVVEATADRVRIKTRFGVQTFPRHDVVRIAYLETPAEQYAERLKRIDRKNVAALLELAAWARDQRLKKQAQATYQLVTEVDPGNRVAHEALGHVLVDGLWLSKKQAAEMLRAREAAEKRAKGLVRYQGAWVTREEMEAREKGWIKVGSRWLPPDEANRARGLVRVDGEWLPRDVADTRRRANEIAKLLNVKLEIAATRHFRVFSEFDAEHAKGVAEAGEKALTIIRDRIGYPGPVWKAETRAEVILLRTPDSYMKMTDRIGADTRQPDGWAEFTKRRTSFYTVLPPVSVQHLGGRRKPDMIFCALHHVGHIALNGMYPNYTYLPIWLDEGFAAWIENATLKESLTACSTTGYGMAAARQDKWSSSAGWKANLKAGLADGSVIPLPRLLTRGLNELSWRDIAKSWSVIDWWVTTDRQRFLKFVKEVRRRYPRYDKHQDTSPNDFATFQNAAMQEVFGTDAAGIEKAWRSHVSANY